MFSKLSTKLVMVSLFFVVLFSANAFADAGISQKTMDVFLKVYPKYVSMARNSKIMPTQSTMNSWGSEIEEGSFDFSKLASNAGDVDAFRIELEALLNAHGMTVEDFSALAAKISVIYSNVTVKQAMAQAQGEDMGALSGYTQQFDQALTNVGIEYNNDEITIVEKNMERLNDLFAKVLLGESV